MSYRRPVPPALEDIPLLVDYVKRSGEKLLPVLRGVESPLEILFPDGSFKTAGFIYQEWPLVAYFNALLRSLLQAVVQGLPSKRKVRILEVGAGSGGTTSALLPSLPPDRTEYIFSDVSELFLTRAEEKFRDYPFLRYSRLDLELDPQAQGFPLLHFDILIAANVLHATRNLPQALANVHSLLAPGGMLLAFEVTEPLAWFDVTTALIEGWGRFEDSLRSNTPLLSAPQWMDALQQLDSSIPCRSLRQERRRASSGSHILIAHTPLDELPAKSDALPDPRSCPGHSQRSTKQREGAGSPAGGTPGSSARRAERTADRLPAPATGSHLASRRSREARPASAFDGLGRRLAYGHRAQEPSTDWTEFEHEASFNIDL